MDEECQHDTPCASQPPQRASKWWHVPDDQIHALVQNIGAAKTTQPRAGTLRSQSASALRSQSAPLKANRTVHFSDGEAGDILDQELRKAAAGSSNVQDKPARKLGSWRVTDERILDIVATKANALAKDGEDVGPVGRVLANYGKFIMGCDGGRVGCNGPADAAASASSSCLQTYACDRTRSEHNVSSLVQRESCSTQKTISHAKQGLQRRPQWNSTSNCRLFAGVGVGLDGRGNKTIKAPSTKFAHCPIYLSDAQDMGLSRVRETVAGHAFYMKRKG